MEGVPYANGAPNLSVDVPAMMDLAQKNQVPISGKDFKTGQTLIKTVIAPGLRPAARRRLDRRTSQPDGEVSTILSRSRRRREQEVGADHILQPDSTRASYGDPPASHGSTPPRGDNEG
jgi:myo-inositol-1-phosphate synthase